MNEIRTKADLVKELDEIIKKFNGGKEFDDKLNDEYIKEHGADIEDIEAFKFGYLLGTVELLKIHVEHFMKDGESELRSIKSTISVTEKLRKENMRDGLIDVVDDCDILFSCYEQIKEVFEEVNADDT